jgi:TonB-dependent receptor
VFSSTLSSSSCQFNQAATVNQYLPQWTAPCYADAYNPSNFILNNINKSLGPSAQTNLQAGGTASRVYQIGSHDSKLEFGGKYRHDRKYNDAYVQTFAPNGTISLSTFPNRLTNSRYYNGGQYPLGYNANYEDVMAYAIANPGAFTTNSTAGHDPSDFTIVEQVGAGYVMNTIDLSNKAKLIAGLRAEGTNANVSNYSIGSFSCAPPQTGTCTSINRNTFSGSYITILPSASLSYGFTPNDTLRLVYARGLARPDFVDLAQTLSWSVSGNGANRYSVSLGNAGLKAETGDDVDVLVDHYFQAFGDLSVGYFYKALRNPIVTQTFVLRDYQPVGGPLANYLGTQPVNAGSAWINGFEVSYLQHLSSLRGFLGGWGCQPTSGTQPPGRPASPAARIIRVCCGRRPTHSTSARPTIAALSRCVSACRTTKRAFTATSSGTGRRAG